MKLSEVAKQKNKYKRNSIELQNAYLDGKLPYDKNQKIREMQDKAYKQFRFYENLQKELSKRQK